MVPLTARDGEDCLGPSSARAARTLPVDVPPASTTQLRQPGYLPVTPPARVVCAAFPAKGEQNCEGLASSPGRDSDQTLVNPLQALQPTAGVAEFGLSGPRQRPFASSARRCQIPTASRASPRESTKRTVVFPPALSTNRFTDGDGAAR